MLGTTLDAMLRDLLREILRGEIIPAVREEIRSALASMTQRATLDEDLLTSEEAGRFARVKPATIRSWLEAGKVTGSRSPGGREWRVRRGDLARLLAGEEKNVSAGGRIGTEEAAEQILAKYTAKMKRKG